MYELPHTPAEIAAWSAWNQNLPAMREEERKELEKMDRAREELSDGWSDSDVTMGASDSDDLDN